MAFTATNLTDVEAAIIALAKGERVAVVNLDGEEIEYTRARLADLIALRDQIRGEIQQTDTTTARYRYISTSKGY